MKDYEFKFTKGAWLSANEFGDNGGDLYAIRNEKYEYVCEDVILSDEDMRLVLSAPKLAHLARKIAMLNQDVGIGQGMLNQLIDESRVILDEVCGDE